MKKKVIALIAVAATLMVLSSAPLLPQPVSALTDNAATAIKAITFFFIIFLLLNLSLIKLTLL